MSRIPKAKPGQIIRYQYLWRWQAEIGRTTGEKDRPACLILATKPVKGEQHVVILPITHSPPRPGIPTYKLPQQLKKLLHLDEENSWLDLSEANVDIWPSPDSVPIDELDGAFLYGILPQKLTRQISQIISAKIAELTLAATDRNAVNPAPQADLSAFTVDGAEFDTEGTKSPTCSM